MINADTEHDRGRHVAAPLRGVKLGLAALLCALVLPSAVAVDAMAEAQGNDIVLEGQQALNVLLWLLIGFLAIPIALWLGVLAVRKNRALGKVFGALGLTIAALAIAWLIFGVLVAEGYFAAWVTG